MEMTNPIDFAAGKMDSPFCRHCVDDLDELKSYEEIFSNQVGFLMENENMTQEDAEKRAKEILAKSPQWKGHAH